MLELQKAKYKEWEEEPSGYVTGLKRDFIRMLG